MFAQFKASAKLPWQETEIDSKRFIADLQKLAKEPLFSIGTEQGRMVVHSRFLQKKAQTLRLASEDDPVEASRSGGGKKGGSGFPVGKALAPGLRGVGEDLNDLPPLRLGQGSAPRLLVIEASYAELERGEWRSKIQPSHLLGSLAAWMAQYSLPIWLAGTREAGAEFCERYLFQCARLIASENADSL